MTTLREDLVAQFLLSTLPSEVLNAYRTVTELNYPISDKHSLVSQLEDLSKTAKQGQERLALALIRDSLGPVDFPIQTPRSALEKFHTRLFPQFEPQLTVPADMMERPSIADVYNETFGPVCGSEALEEYRRAKIGGLDELQAIIVGHQAGRRCQQRLAELLRRWRPWPRRPWF